MAQIGCHNKRVLASVMPVASRRGVEFVEKGRLREPLQLCTRLVHNYPIGFFGLGQLCIRLLHNYRLRPRLGEGPHIFEIARGEALLAGKLALEINRKPSGHPGPQPSFR